MPVAVYHRAPVAPNNSRAAATPRRERASGGLLSAPVEQPTDFTWPDEIPRDAVASVLVVLKDRSGVRLDKFIVGEMPRLSRNRAAKIAKDFAFDDAGRKLSPAKIVRAGERIVLFRLRWDEPEAPRDVTVIYEDDAIVAVDKPAGLPVHPTARYLRNTLTAVLEERYPKQVVHLCHRLDKETSGVIVAARSVELEVKLKAAFAGRDVKKRYLAIAHGAPREDSLVIDAPMALAGHEVGVLMAVTPVERGGLLSRTRVRVIERFGAFSLLECMPETGRQHQIRVHLAHIGTPIVGDKLYAHSPEVFIASLEDKLTDEMRAALLLDRHALHAAAITFDHPRSGASITIEAPLPAQLRAFIEENRR
jgi:23S rRNA pseudouridine1911/1915/1917 synthase